MSNLRFSSTSAMGGLSRILHSMRLRPVLGNSALVKRMQTEVDASDGPELINDGPSTAPSKRLERHSPGYMKTIDGPLAISALGLVRLRAQCLHLDKWLCALGS